MKLCVDRNTCWLCDLKCLVVTQGQDLTRNSEHPHIQFTDIMTVNDDHALLVIWELSLLNTSYSPLVQNYVWIIKQYSKNGVKLSSKHELSDSEVAALD